MKCRNLLFLIWASVLALNLARCTADSTPTLPIQPAAPTLTPVEDFECWTAPQREVTAPDDEMGQLIISLRNGTLYRRDISTTSYSLIDSGINIETPSASPDGRYLLYSVPQAHIGDVLFIYDLLTRRKIQTSFMENEWNPVVNWSADGQCLIGWSIETSTTSGWHSATASAYRLADGARQQKAVPQIQVKYDGIRDVRPSPNGHWWAWPCVGKGGVCVKASNGPQIYDPALNLPKDIDEDSQMFYQRGLLRWSPNSEALAFVYATRYYVADLQLRIVHFVGNEITSYEDFKQRADDLRWSPDGRWLLIFDRYGNPRLKLYDVANRTILDLSNVHGYSESTIPAWSPSGKQIVFVGQDDNRLYIMNVDGTGLHEVPALSPDVTSNQPIGDIIFWVP